MSTVINWPRIAGLPMSAYLAASRATFAAAPTLETFLHVLWDTPDGVALANNCVYILRLEHTIRLFGRNDASIED